MPQENMRIPMDELHAQMDELLMSPESLILGIKEEREAFRKARDEAFDIINEIQVKVVGKTENKTARVLAYMLGNFVSSEPEIPQELSEVQYKLRMNETVDIHHVVVLTDYLQELIFTKKSLKNKFLSEAGLTFLLRLINEEHDPNFSLIEKEVAARRTNES